MNPQEDGNFKKNGTKNTKGVEMANKSQMESSNHTVVEIETNPMKISELRKKKRNNQDDMKSKPRNLEKSNSTCKHHEILVEEFNSDDESH